MSNCTISLLRFARFAGLLTVCIWTFPYSVCAQTSPVTLLDALDATLAKNPTVQQDRTAIDLAKSQVRRQRGVFDSQYTFTGSGTHSYQPLTDYEHSLALAAGVDTFQQELNVVNFHAQDQKLYTFGGRLAADFDSTRLDDNLENIGGVNRTNLNVVFTMPLLRGRGTAATTALWRAAQLDLKGTTDDWNASTSATLLSTVDHYFALVAAQQQMTLMQASEANERAMHTEVQELIAGDKLPQLSLSDADAAAERQHLRVLEARLALSNARATLAADMGLDVLEAPLLTAADEPLPAPAKDLTPTDLSTAVARGIAQRSEVLGGQKHADAARLQRDAAINGVKRQLDASVSSGYTGLTLGTGPLDYADSIGNRIGGANITGSLTYHLDHGNAAARANLESTEAELSRARFGEMAVEARIRTEITGAYDELEYAREAIASTQSIEASMNTAAEGRMERLKAGAGQLADVLSAQDHLIDAKAAVVEAQRRYATAVAHFHYATGTMLGGDAAHPTLERSTFYTEVLPPATVDRSVTR